MKIVSTLFLLIVSVNIYAQKPKFHRLIDPHLQAGCFIENDMEEVVANLSFYDDQGETVGIFRLGDQDELLPYSQGTKAYPEVFENETYKIFIKSTLTKKDPDSCLEYQRFKVKVIFEGKTYRYRFSGFCGC